MKLTIDDVRSRFIEHFDGTTGSVYASPGRINLIGEHTDYNDGFVFPGAVKQGMIAEIKLGPLHFRRMSGNDGIGYSRRRL